MLYQLSYAREAAHPSRWPNTPLWSPYGSRNRARSDPDLALALVSAIVLLYAGMWWGSREKTCAVVPSSAGNVVLCSNDWAEKVGQ